MLQVVVDKSYAEAVPTQLRELSTRFTIWVPSAFFYEVFDLKTDPRRRRASLGGFDEFRRVDIVSVLKKEAAEGAPAGEINARRLSVNPDVLASKWSHSPDEMASVIAYESAIVAREIAFWREVISRGVPGFSSGEMEAVEGSQLEFSVLCEKLRDRDRIRKVAAELNIKHASVLDVSWLHFRRLQAMLLQGLVLRRRYRTSTDSPSMTRLEHDVQDIEYLTLGLHAGRLATGETSAKPAKASMAWRFRLLEPKGTLFTPSPSR